MKQLAMVAVALLASGVAWAQASFPTAAAGVRAGGTVMLVCDAAGKNCAPAGQSNPLTAAAPMQAATTWSNGAVAQDMRAFATVELEVSGLSGGDTITVFRTLTAGGTPKAQAWVDGTLQTGTAIGSDGTYSFTGSGFMTWSKTGAASTPAVVIRGSN
ncbi:hypothetical protein [Sphingomonas jatrophae]|uniref:Uncharacterized protein n=1 Tax=Sphingomonas jatrophae TaxID=1166337 RepID=A0A1I6K643_9SPHN|nr:hypothetical protein [Sphingomonas jatrophae]SFR86711.1 hypothetical protein SAMN05192580_1369 [Sphingomonas jatrophae]